MWSLSAATQNIAPCSRKDTEAFVFTRMKAFRHQLSHQRICAFFLPTGSAMAPTTRSEALPEQKEELFLYDTSGQETLNTRNLSF